MNKNFIFFIFSSVVFIISLIVLCLSPIINNTYIKTYGFNFSSWSTLNCQYYEDMEGYDKLDVDDLHFYERNKNLCRRKKAMHDLEYATLIINLFLGFICSNLSMFQYLNIGKKIHKKMGFIGAVFGFCAFILTLVYICFNGYILTNDSAYERKIIKKFPNGAMYKYVGGKYITAYEDVYKDDGEYIKYKDLREKQYNYDNEYFKKFIQNPNDCKIPTSSFNKNKYIQGCDYIFANPVVNNENKNLYDKWVACLVFDVFILIGELGIFILGLIIFIKSKGVNELENTIDN